jgi:hypothetical protein
MNGMKTTFQKVKTSKIISFSCCDFLTFLCVGSKSIANKANIADLINIVIDVLTFL